MTTKPTAERVFFWLAYTVLVLLSVIGFGTLENNRLHRKVVQQESYVRWLEREKAAAVSKADSLQITLWNRR